MEAGEEKVQLIPISPQIYNPFRKPVRATEYEWVKKAACRGLPPEWWFPKYEKTTDTKNRQRVKKDDRLAKEERAKSICATCPVRQECLDFGTLLTAEEGIWGGYNEDERRSWNRQTPRWIRCAQCSNIWYRNQGVRKHCEICGRKWRE